MALNFSLKLQSDENKGFHVEQAEIQYIVAGDGVGDMLKSTYDANGNGIVDNAEKLGGNAPAYYAAQTDVTALSARVAALETDVAAALADI